MKSKKIRVLLISFSCNFYNNLVLIPHGKHLLCPSYKNAFELVFID
jgi:hypothetical protein